MILNQAVMCASSFQTSLEFWHMTLHAKMKVYSRVYFQQDLCNSERFSPVSLYFEYNSAILKLSGGFHYTLEKNVLGYRFIQNTQQRG